MLSEEIIKNMRDSYQADLEEAESRLIYARKAGLYYGITQLREQEVNVAKAKCRLLDFILEKDEK